MFDLNLVEEQLSPLLLPQVHHLHGHLAPAVPLAGNAHHTGGPLPDLHKVPQSRPRVPRVHYHLQRCLELLVSHLPASAGRCQLGEGGGARAGRGSS